MPPTKKGSVVWRAFIKTNAGGKCKLCQCEVKSGGNTTNLKKHLMRKHPNYDAEDEVDVATKNKQPRNTEEVRPEKLISRPSTSAYLSEEEDDDVSAASSSTATLYNLVQPGIAESFTKMTSYSDTGSRGSKITNAIIYMIAKDNLPLSTTEKDGFKYLMKTTAPLYHVPGRKSITKYIDNKYDVLASIMKNYLGQVDHFTLTTDIWTETMNTKSFLSLTCHFFLTDSLHWVTIGVTELNDRHTAEYIADSLRKLCVEWNIPLSRVTAIVTDNGKNMVKAVSDLLGKNFHLPCFAHTLDLVASNIVDTEDVKQILDKIKCIVTYFKQSVVAADELRKAQGVESLKLIQSVPTRWNSTFYMIERFLKLCSFVAPILLKFPKSPPMIDASELEVVKEIITVLAPIEAVSKEICGEKYLTCSKVIPIINCLSQNLKKLSPSTEYGIKFLTRTLNEVQKRFGAIEQNKILAISCILDPRFKKLHFNNVNACAQAINSINSYSNIVNEEQEQAAGHVQMKSTSDLEGGFSLW